MHKSTESFVLSLVKSPQRSLPLVLWVSIEQCTQHPAREDWKSFLTLLRTGESLLWSQVKIWHLHILKCNSIVCAFAKIKIKNYAKYSKSRWVCITADCFKSDYECLKPDFQTLHSPVVALRFLSYDACCNLLNVSLFISL